MEDWERVDFEIHLNSGINLPATPVFPNGVEIEGMHPIDHGTYFEYRCPDAQTLLAALDIEATMYRLPSGKTRPFIFRGHKKAEWRLEPSVFRKLDANQLSTHRGQSGNRYEFQLFSHFLNGVDQLGYFLEDESHALLEHLRFKTTSNDNFSFSNHPPFKQAHFPSKKQLRSLALAQHFGIPTRLLDWTRNPYVGLFFATCDIFDIKKEGPDNRFAVWVMPQILLEITKKFKFLEIADVPKFQNENIVAQQGLFTSHIPPKMYEGGTHVDLPHAPEGGRFPYLDEYLMDASGDALHQRVLDEITGKPFCFTLKYDEIGLIRRKLDQLNITWASLMPNLEGVTKEALRRRDMDGY